MLTKAPEVQRFLASQTPKPPLRMKLALVAGRWWPWFVGLAVAFVLAAAASHKHWGA